MLLLKLLKACIVSVIGAPVPVRFTVDAVDAMCAWTYSTGVVQVESWVSIPCGPGPAVAQLSLMLDYAIPHLFCKSRLLEFLFPEDNYTCAMCVAHPHTQMYF